MTGPVELRDYIEDTAKATKKDPVIGEVTKVFEHTSSDDDSNHEVNVLAANGEEEYRRIPIHVGSRKQAKVPQKGDSVLVDFLGSETQRPFVSQFVHTLNNRAPLAKEGHFRHRFKWTDPYLFLEAESNDHSKGPPDTVRMSKKSDGLSNPSLTIEIDDSGNDTVARIGHDADTGGNMNLAVGIDESGPTAFIGSDTNDDGTFDAKVELDDSGNITIQADSDLTLSAPNGNVKIDEGGSVEKVAKQNHDHDFDYDGGGDNSSTLSATTNTPNQSGTEVELQ